MYICNPSLIARLSDEEGDYHSGDPAILASNYDRQKPSFDQKNPLTIAYHLHKQMETVLPLFVPGFNGSLQ
jgi:hypothetical protein